MNIRIIMAALSLLSTTISIKAQDSAGRICVISDTHVMAPSLLKQDGKAFQDYLAADRKLLKESPELMDSAVARIRQAHPQALLITGDLTKDGEQVSHRYLVEHHLAGLDAAGRDSSAEVTRVCRLCRCTHGGWDDTRWNVTAGKGSH